eukprot:s740_g5.t1
MLKKSRMRNVQVEQFNLYFEKASWCICAQLRANTTWKEASEEVMQDIQATQEALTSSAKRKTHASKETSANGNTGPPPKKGKGKGGFKGGAGKGGLESAVAC